jgi:hypothetical protein
VLERINAGPRRAHALHKLAYLVDDAGALAMAEAALAAAGDDDELCADIELSASLFAEMGGDPARSRRYWRRPPRGRRQPGSPSSSRRR